MKYGIGKIETLPFEIPILKIGTALNGNVLVVVAYYGVAGNKVHSFMIQWKYRVHLNDKHLFTFIGESKFLIQDDSVPVVISQMDRFINDLYLNYEIHWEEKTKETPLKGTTLPDISMDIPTIRQQILDYLQ